MSDFQFTPTNLAILGMLDDFYNLYCEVKEVYETHRKIYIRENGHNFPLMSNTWDEISLRDVRRKFEPYLQKYLYLYNTGYDEVYANAYAFKDFSFINRDKRTVKLNSVSPFILSFKSFSDFLIDVQVIIACLDYRKTFIKKPNHTIQESWTTLNDKFESLVSKGIEECQSAEIKNIPISNDVLYIFDKLSSTSCYNNGHPVISARYIATITQSAKKVSLPVHYCDYCKKYFIGAKTLSVFEKRFGKLIIEKKDISEMQIKFGCFNAESKLHSLGYNVIRGNMTAEEREQLLIYLLENKLITYFELCSTIEQNISIFKNSPRHKYAVEKWQLDLKIIGNYVLKHPEKKN